jgi:hypothetical protein
MNFKIVNIKIKFQDLCINKLLKEDLKKKLFLSNSPKYN